MPRRSNHRYEAEPSPSQLYQAMKESAFETKLLREELQKIRRLVGSALPGDGKGALGGALGQVIAEFLSGR